MKHRNRQWKKRILTMVSVFAAAVMAVSFSLPVQAAGGSYKVSFKAGAKGTIGGMTSTSKTVSYEETVNVDQYQTLVKPDAGYYFTGWSPDAAGNVVITKKTSYVAQYARIIDEAVYRVNYIDTYGNQVATQKVVTTNAGANVTEAAIPAADYAVDSAVKNAVVNKDGTTEITFVYTSTVQPNVVVETETVTLPGGTTVTVVAGTTPAAGTTQAAGTGAGTAAATAGEETPQTPVVVNPDENTPLANQDITNKEDNTVKSEDEETPLAKQEVSGNKNVLVYGAAGIILVIAAITAAFAYLKRKK